VTDICASVVIALRTKTPAVACFAQQQQQQQQQLLQWTPMNREQLRDE